MRYRLHYIWTGWASKTSQLPHRVELPVEPWKKDGLTVVEWRHAPSQIQIAFQAPPQLSPVGLARLAKGRLHYALRDSGCSFSRKISVRAVGYNTQGVVDQYLETQQVHSDLADDRFKRKLEALTYRNPDFEMERPRETGSGRYWYNLHLVFVTSGRIRMGAVTAGNMVKSCREAAEAARIEVAKISIMPDHIHLAVQGTPELTPEEIGRKLQRASARVAGCRGFWQDGFYAGTIGVYSLHVITGR